MLLRTEFKKKQLRLHKSKVIFIDESGMRLGIPPHYGWSERGSKCLDHAPHKTWETITMIGAIGLNGFRGFMTIDDATSGDVFHAFVEQQLAPHLKHGDVVIMDNLASHKNKHALDIIYLRGASVEFLPPYSPDLNPIEKTWSKMKTDIRRANTLSRDSFDKAVAGAMSRVSSDDINGWFAHAGYVAT